MTFPACLLLWMDTLLIYRTVKTDKNSVWDKKSVNWFLIWWHHCRESPSRRELDFQTCAQRCLRPSAHNQVFSKISPSLVKVLCETMLLASCWCTHNCVEVLHTLGISGRGKNAGKSWVSTISTAISQISMVEGLLGHPHLLGNTLVEKDGLCHSTCERIHGWLSY